MKLRRISRYIQKVWAQVKGAVNPEIYADVAGRLAKQQKEALWWRDAWVLYLQQYARQPIPSPYKKPERSLEEVKESVNVYLLK